MFLFTEKIADWDDWERLFQSGPSFKALIEHIFEKENLPMSDIENLTPGTNAVFKVGKYVVKIYVPVELGDDFGTDFGVELFGIKWANKQNVPSPKLVVYGEVDDKYHFRYMIMEHINGKLFSEIEKELSYNEKVIIGQKMRVITDRLNKPCENFTSIDVLRYALTDKEWNEAGFPESFRVERLEYLKNVNICDKDKVYCHGDIHSENVLVDDDFNLFIIDFGDAMYAPLEFDRAYIVSGLFCFEKPYLIGYYGEYNVGDIVELCMKWLPIHVWGHAVVSANLKPVSAITSFEIMHKRLDELIRGQIEFIDRFNVIF